MMSKKEKYYRYIVEDITDSIVFKRPAFPHVGTVHGVKINTCNLNSGKFFRFLVENYGIEFDTIEFKIIVKMLIRKLKELNLFRCD